MGTTRITTTLTDTQLQTAQNQAAQIASSSTETISANKFVFFAAFDGTNNDRSDPKIAGNTQSTNVGQMADQVEAMRAGSNGLSATSVFVQ